MRSWSYKIYNTSHGNLFDTDLYYSYVAACQNWFTTDYICTGKGINILSSAKFLVCLLIIFIFLLTVAIMLTSKTIKIKKRVTFTSTFHVTCMQICFEIMGRSMQYSQYCRITCYMYTNVHYIESSFPTVFISIYHKIGCVVGTWLLTLNIMYFFLIS